MGDLEESLRLVAPAVPEGLAAPAASPLRSRRILSNNLSL